MKSGEAVQLVVLCAADPIFFCMIANPAPEELSIWRGNNFGKKSSRSFPGELVPFLQIDAATEKKEIGFLESRLNTWHRRKPWPWLEIIQACPFCSQKLSNLRHYLRGLGWSTGELHVKASILIITSTLLQVFSRLSAASQDE